MVLSDKETVAKCRFAVVPITTKNSQRKFLFVVVDRLLDPKTVAQFKTKEHAELFLKALVDDFLTGEG